MSKYTTELRFICETIAGEVSSQGYGKVEDIINKSWRDIFDFDFDIFDEAYRQVLCKKIIRHYYTREIGFETVGLWKLKLATKMQEIMPYYNKLYKSELIEFNPLWDADYTREGNVKDEGENEKSNSGNKDTTGTNRKVGNIVINDSENGTNWNVYSDTPQGALTNVDNETYLTDARKITDNRTGNRNIDNTEQDNIINNERMTNLEEGNFNTTKDYIEHVSGKFPGKSSAKMIMEFRESLLNIDMQIIDELNKLFMLVW